MRPEPSNGRQRACKRVSDAGCLNPLVVGMTEDAVHAALVQHLKLRAAPGVVWFHPANGGIRHIATAARMKRLGVRPGVPDLALIIAGRPYFLELKRAKGGRLSNDQRAMHDELRAAGAVVAVANGLDDALEVLGSWGVFQAQIQDESKDMTQ